jgi:hypothetical protein
VPPTADFPCNNQPVHDGPEPPTLALGCRWQAHRLYVGSTRTRECSIEWWRSSTDNHDVLATPQRMAGDRLPPAKPVGSRSPAQILRILKQRSGIPAPVTHEAHPPTSLIGRIAVLASIRLAQHSMLHREFNQLRIAPQAMYAHDIILVKGNGPRSDAKPSGHLLHRQTAHKQ